MRRVVLIVVMVVLVIAAAVVGVGYLAIRDESSAMNELGNLQDQILDIQKQAQGNPSVDSLKRMAIRLNDISSELSYLPSRHRLASMFFSSVKLDVDEVINQDVRIVTAINQKISAR
jgi:hypothetical protein